MATRRNTRAKEAQLGFEAIAIEGSARGVSGAVSPPAGELSMNRAT
jgi:hypothetical protein